MDLNICDDLPIGKYKDLKVCRFCDGNLNSIFHLGNNMPLAGGFLRDLEKSTLEVEKAFPLTLVQCQKCLVVQCKQVVDRNELFRKGYFYYSSMIPTLVAHFKNYAKQLSDKYKNKEPNMLLVEMGCNDGVFLRPLKKEGFKVVGIDPSNTVKSLIDDGFSIYNTFMSDEVVDDIISNHGYADLFLSSNSFAHIDDMKTIFRCMKKLLKKEGLAIIEVHYLTAIIEELNFDFIYHEHMSYYSISSFINICCHFGMTLIDVDITSIHGKSIRVYISNKTNDVFVNENKMNKLLAKEENIRNVNKLISFSKNIYNWRDDFIKKCNYLIDNGCDKIYGYGASGRATTLCNFVGLNFKVVIDDAASKIGSYTPKYHSIICHSDILYNDHPPSVVIILAWPYAKPIIKKHRKYVENDGKFIIPLPRIIEITKDNIDNFKC